MWVAQWADDLVCWWVVLSAAWTVEKSVVLKVDWWAAQLAVEKAAQWVVH
jgi:hypothetical protein